MRSILSNIISSSILGAALVTAACDGVHVDDGVAVAEGALAQALVAAPTVLHDEAIIDLYVELEDGEVLASVYRDGAWEPLDGPLSDLIGADNALTEVTLRVQAAPGNMVSLRSGGGAWSAWSAGEVELELAVPVWYPESMSFGVEREMKESGENGTTEAQVMVKHGALRATYGCDEAGGSGRACIAIEKLKSGD